MRAFTFSTAERAEQCPGSQALEQIPSTSIYARLGTILHAYVMRALSMGREEALELEPEHMRRLLESYDLWGLPQAGEFAAEVAYALDPITGKARELGRDLERKYDEAGARENEIVGAADFVAISSDGVYVDDLKTGHSHLTRAADNLQVTGLAVAAARAYGAKRARVRLLIRREDNSGYFDEASLDDFELDFALYRLRQAVKSVEEARAEVAAGKTPRLHEGPWCEHCPARAGCPAKVALVREFAIAPEDGASRIRGLVSRVEWRQALLRLRAAKKELGRIEAEIHAYVREVGPVDLGDGLEYGERTIMRPVIDGKIAHKEIVAFLDGRGKEIEQARDVADNACTFQTSKAAIKRALAKVAPPRGATRLFNDVMEVIHDAGGVEFRKQTRVDEHLKKEIPALAEGDEGEESIQ